MNNLLSLFHLGYISSTDIDKVSQQGRNTLNGQSDGFGVDKSYTQLVHRACCMPSTTCISY